MSRRILVVDDEKAIRRSLGNVLEDEQYEVVLAETGEEGLERVEAEDPDLVLLDIWLPGMDGIETLTKIKERSPALPVLMMSGHGTIETAVTATKLGAYDFIEKPLNLDKLLLSIEHAFNAGAQPARFDNRPGLGRLMADPRYQALKTGTNQRSESLSTQ